MISIDTNILIRIIVEDNDIQAQKALKLINKEQEVFISALVICETAWVLESSYKLKKDEIIDVFENILRVSQFNIERSDAIWLALNEYKRINMDFSDCLIGAVAKINDSSPVMTFDKNASRSNLFKLIK